MEFPEYETPEGVGDGTTTAADPAIAPEPGTEPAQPAQPEGGDPAAAAGATGDDSINARLQEIEGQLADTVSQRDTLRRQRDEDARELKRIRGAMAAAFGVETPGARPDPKRESVRQKFLDLFPEFKGLLELGARKDDLLGLASEVPQIRSSTANYWNRVATMTVGKVQDAIAAKMYGDGKVGKDLTEKQRQRVASDFSVWCEGDRTGKRIERYEALDPSLLDEFLADVEEVYLTPFRRQSSASVLARAAKTRNLPVGGSSSSPVSAAPNVKKPATDDEAADLAWQRAQEALAQ